jgi:putative nucleotidyltransferase with HDIG domain
VTTLDLPVLSPPRLRALAMLADESVHPVEVAGVVKSDPALTILVIRAANSALSYPRDPITRIEQAIVRIGLRETRQIVGAAAVRQSFRNIDKAGLDGQELWRHVILCAVLAEGMTRIEPNVQIVRDSAFTAGLLHDVGRLQLASRHPLRYRRAVDLVREGAEPIEAEHEAIEGDHAQWGDEVARVCRLSDEIRAAIGNHHDAASGDRLTQAVTRSRGIAHALGVGDGLPAAGTPPALDRDDRRLVESLGGERALLDHVESFRRTIS